MPQSELTPAALAAELRRLKPITEDSANFTKFAEANIAIETLMYDNLPLILAALEDAERLDWLLSSGIETGYDIREDRTVFAYDRAAIDAVRGK